ncbi:hypothetical protein MAR_002617, partial [Mya arenaria]
SACSESQCGNYTNLTETTLRTDNSNPRHIPIPVGWYRYTGTDAGIMATSCPKGNNQCGAKQQVWIKGGLPAVSTGPVDVDACIRIENPNGEPLCCDLQNTICVENCGVFYIYLFRPLRGDTNFCFS